MAHRISPTVASRGTSRLGGAQHHGCRALVARVAKLADASHILVAAMIECAASSRVPPPEERLFGSLCEEDGVFEGVGALQHNLLSGKGL